MRHSCRLVLLDECKSDKSVASTLAEPLLLRHVVVASACESLGKDGRIEVVRLAEIVQGFAVVADHGVDHADQ